MALSLLSLMMVFADLRGGALWFSLSLFKFLIFCQNVCGFESLSSFL